MKYFKIMISKIPLINQENLLPSKNKNNTQLGKCDIFNEKEILVNFQGLFFNKFIQRTDEYAKQFYLAKNIVVYQSRLSFFVRDPIRNLNISLGQ